jgi:hypothetical protein
MVEVIVTAKNGGTVLRPDIWNEIHEVNEFIIRKLVITRDERNIRFVIHSKQRCPLVAIGPVVFGNG